MSIDSKIKQSKRLELICEYLKTGVQPDGYKITESKNPGKYRLTKLKSQREILESRRVRLTKALETVNTELDSISSGSQSDEPIETSDEQPIEPIEQPCDSLRSLTSEQ